MTAYEKALKVLAEHGPLAPGDFAVRMWPLSARERGAREFASQAGEFLAGMARRGLVRKSGDRKYYLERR